MVVAVVAGMAMVVPLLARQGALGEPKAILTFLVGLISCVVGVFMLVRTTRAQARLEDEAWHRGQRGRIGTPPVQPELIPFATGAAGWPGNAGNFSRADDRADVGSRLRAEVRVAAAALLASMEEETDEEGLIVCPAPPRRAGCSRPCAPRNASSSAAARAHRPRSRLRLRARASSTLS